MTGLERLADTSPGRRAALTDTGRSDRAEGPIFDDRKRPEPVDPGTQISEPPCQNPPLNVSASVHVECESFQLAHLGKLHRSESL
jgi:hypothetical protein